MKASTKISSDQRRAGIIQAVRKVFVEKGFHGTTTRELALAAGVSEALLFKHFPSKEALYRAMELSCVKQEHSAEVDRLEALEPSTAALVYLVHLLVSRMLERRVPDDNERSLIRLMLRSLTDDGEFARLAFQGVPSQFIGKVETCLVAAIASGDAVAGPVGPRPAAWFAHHLAAMLMIHCLPREPVVDYGLSREELGRQLAWFILRGAGLKEEAIRRYDQPQVLAIFES
jgi:AcrR family transcriptional regulator